MTLIPASRLLPGSARWLPTLVRVLVARELAWPAISKFAAVNERVTDFRHHGIPTPELMVTIVGVFELAALVAVVSGVGLRVVALPLVVIMAVAISTAGLSSANAAVLLGAIVLAVVGPGRLVARPSTGPMRERRGRDRVKGPRPGGPTIVAREVAR